MALLNLLEQTQLTGPAADPLLAQRKHRWPWTAMPLQQGCRNVPQSMQGCRSVPQCMQGCTRGSRKVLDAVPAGLMLVAQLLLPAPLWALQENKPPLLGPRLMEHWKGLLEPAGALEEAAGMAWFPTSSSWCPGVRGQPVRARRLSISMPC